MPNLDWREILSTEHGIENEKDLRNYTHSLRLIDLVKQNPRELGLASWISEEEAQFQRDTALRVDYAKAVARSLGLVKGSISWNLFIFFRMNRLWDWCRHRDYVEYFEEELGDIISLGGVWGMQFDSLRHLYIAGVRSPGKAAMLLKFLYQKFNNHTVATHHWNYARGVHVGEAIWQFTNKLQRKNLRGGYRFRRFMEITRISAGISVSPISDRYYKLFDRLDQNSLFLTISDERNWDMRHTSRVFRPNVVVKSITDWAPIKLNHQVDQKWFISVGRVPKDPVARDLPLPLITGLSKKAFGQVMSLAQKAEILVDNKIKEEMSHHYLSLVRLSINFSKQEIMSVHNSTDLYMEDQNGKLIPQVIHDLGINLPDFPLSQDQVKFMKRYKHIWSDACRVVSSWDAVIKEGHNPLSKDGLKLSLDILKSMMYHSVIDKGLAAECTKFGYSQPEFEEVQYRWLKGLNSLTHLCIPKVDFLEEGYRCYILDKDDPRGIFLGEYTGCCQHPKGAGKECAEHGHKSSEGAFFVIEKQGKIVAQSWVWRLENTLVFDNIEGGYGDKEVLADLYYQAAKKFVGTLGIENVYVGTAGSDVRIASDYYDFGRKPDGYGGYTDSRSVWVLEGSI